MTRPSFAAFILLSGVPLLAQTSPAQLPPRATSPAAPPQTITMTGCVGGQGSDAQPFMLNNAVIVPTTSATAPGTQPPTVPPGATPSQPPTVPPGAVAGAQPPTVAPVPPPTTPAAVPPSPAPLPPSTAGTSGSTPTSVASGAGGTSATAGTSATVAASGANAVTGYRLSGSDLTPWAGRRVEIVGMIVKTSPSVSTGAGPSTTAPEFRVQSVRPIEGTCPRN